MRPKKEKKTNKLRISIDLGFLVSFLTHLKWYFDDLSLCLLTTHNQNDPLNSTLSFVSVCMFETERSDNIAYLLRSPHDHTPTQVKPLFRSNFGLYVYSCSDFFSVRKKYALQTQWNHNKT